MRKKVKGIFEDDYPHGKIIGETTARADFKAARDYARTLLKIHDEQTGGAPGRPGQELEALKVSALILSVTAWECFVEDTVSKRLDVRLGKAKVASDLSSTFQSVAHAWLEEKKRKPPELLIWADVGWKAVIRKSLKDKIAAFNTPNTENTSSLFKKFLGVNISAYWRWKHMSAQNAGDKLDSLIRLRGRVVHQGKKLFDPTRSQPVKRAQVVDALNFLYQLVDATERALGVAPRVQGPLEIGNGILYIIRSLD